MTYHKVQDPADAYEAEQWFADMRLFRDCRFDGGKWVGPIAQIRNMPLELTSQEDGDVS